MSGIVKTGQSVTAVFATSSPTTGAATSADSTPTGTLYVNGTADAATVTVTNITTGRYKAAVTLPTLAAGDVVDIWIAATVGGIAGGGVVWSAAADTKRLSDTLSADVVAISGDSAAADNLEAAADGTGYNLGGGSVVAASVTGAVGSVAAGGITAASIATGAVDADALAADAVAEIAAGITIPSAATIADAVWDEALSGHLTAGTAGHALSEAGSAADPMENAASGYLSGTLGYIISRLTSARVTVQSLLTMSGDIPEIVAGADYNATDGTAFDWTNTGGSWPTLTDATVTWEGVAPNGETQSFSMSVTDGVGDEKTVRLQLTDTQTTALAADYLGVWDFAVWAVLSSGSRVRLVRGRATVVDGPEPA